MEILQKGTLSAEFRPELCGPFVFPQNLHTTKLGEITVFYVVFISERLVLALALALALVLALLFWRLKAKYGLLSCHFFQRKQECGR